jgi:hypothetical protein
MMSGPTAWAEPIGAKYGDGPNCPVCGEPIGSREWLPPRRIALRRGTRSTEPTDFIAGPGFGPFVASATFVAAWERASLRGVIEWAEVEVVRRPELEYRLPILPVPHVRATLLKPKYMSGPPTCNYCQQATTWSFKGIEVDISSWDEEDLFEPLVAGEYMVTDRFKEVVEDGGFTGANWVQAERYRPFEAKD